MSSALQNLAGSGTAHKPRPAGGLSRPGRQWYAWFVALCLILLAYNSQRQLEVQRRLLGHSQELERLVGRSRNVSAQMNTQLEAVRELDRVTARMDAQLAAIMVSNAGAKSDLDDLERTVASIHAAVVALDGQAGQSRSLLEAMARESAALHRTLSQSRQVGADVSAYLLRLVQRQEAINADLADMERKTRALDRLGRGG